MSFRRIFIRKNYFCTLLIKISFILPCISSEGEIYHLTERGDLLGARFTAQRYIECATHTRCLPKCCGMNELLTVTVDLNSSCHNNSESLHPILSIRTLLAEPISDNTWVDFIQNDSLKLFAGKLYMYEQFCFRIQEDGFLMYRDHTSNWVKMSPEDYCVDRVKFEIPLPGIPLEFSGDELNYGFLTNTPLYEYAYVGGVMHTIFGTGFIVGSFFLLATFLVYALLWKEQNIQGLITMSHSATMFLWYFFYGWSILVNPETPDRYRRSTACVVLGIVQHFFILSNYCWLTVNSFSLFWTCRTLDVPNRRDKNIGQYLCYAAVGWGVPFIFVLVSVIVDQKYSYDPCNVAVVPEYGYPICFVSLNALGPYMYYPLIVVMSFNFIFFWITAYKLYGYNKRSSMARDKLRKANELFPLIGKLFFLTGFTWIIELVTWIQSRDSTEHPWYFGIACSISILQVVPIFVIYISKPSLLKSLKTTYPRLRSIWNTVEICASCSCRVYGSLGNFSTGVTTVSKDEGRVAVDLKSCSAIHSS